MRLKHGFLIIVLMLFVVACLVFPSCLISPFFQWGMGGGDSVPASPTVCQDEKPPLPNFILALEKALPTVVRITTSEDGSEGKCGSGVIYTADGYILTCNHVVENASDIKVDVPDVGSFSNAKVWCYPDVDLAVVKINAKDPLPYVEIAPPESVGVGQWVLAIGYAYNIPGSPTVSQGIISATNRSIGVDGHTFTDIIQTSAPLNPGNSGGPLVGLSLTEDGEHALIVGINDAIIKDADNMGFAISNKTIMDVFEI